MAGERGGDGDVGQGPRRTWHAPVSQNWLVRTGQGKNQAMAGKRANMSDMGWTSRNV